MNVAATMEAKQDLRERLRAGAGFSLDRLPLLRAIFEEMASGFEETIRRLSDPSMKFFVDQLAIGRVNDIFEAHEGCALTAVYSGGGDLDAKILMGVDHNFVYSLVEALFGSDGSEAPCEEERSLTNIEVRVGHFAFARLTKALQDSFTSLARVSFEMEPVASKFDFTAAGRKNGPAVTCRCKLAIFDREGEIFLVVPQPVLEPFREALSRDPSAEPSLLDPHWAKRMQNRVTRTEVSVHAVMEKDDLTLGDIARFEVGQIVELPISPTSLIKLQCEGQALFWCALGQKDGVYTVRIEDQVDLDQEFIDDVLGG